MNNSKFNSLKDKKYDFESICGLKRQRIDHILSIRLSML